MSVMDDAQIIGWQFLVVALLIGVFGAVRAVRRKSPVQLWLILLLLATHAGWFVHAYSGDCGGARLVSTAWTTQLIALVSFATFEARWPRWPGSAIFVALVQIVATIETAGSVTSQRDREINLAAFRHLVLKTGRP